MSERALLFLAATLLLAGCQPTGVFQPPRPTDDDDDDSVGDDDDDDDDDDDTLNNWEGEWSGVVFLKGNVGDPAGGEGRDLVCQGQLTAVVEGDVLLAEGSCDFFVPLPIQLSAQLSPDGVLEGVLLTVLFGTEIPTPLSGWVEGDTMVAEGYDDSLGWARVAALIELTR